MDAAQLKKKSLIGMALSITLILAILVLFFIVPIFVLLRFENEIKQAQGYGYLGVFFVGLLCGITVIPAPTQMLIFTFGRVLNPWFVGLIAGLGSGLGGITVYLTGAGVQSIWSRLRHRQLSLERRLGMADGIGLQQSQFWRIGKALYERLADWISGRRGAWALFVTSALPISPFYPAGLAAGSMGMSLRRFFLVSWAGRTARYVLVSLAGWAGLGLIERLLRMSGS